MDCKYIAFWAIQEIYYEEFEKKCFPYGFFNYFCRMNTNAGLDFTVKLMDWYRANQRDLPWRHSKDPYHVWVSEIILQQTRVGQGADYYHRFVRRFPSLDALAEATEDEVLKYWQGLGYYARARNLHAAAKSMQGVFPATYEGVRALKGVGDYTAAAICSIAYGLPYAAVDGNAYRLFSRYFGIEEPVDSLRGKKMVAALAQEMLDEKQPGAYNQAVMDFGSLQCVPSSPDCNACVLRDSCWACANGMAGKLPVKTKKTAIRERYLSYTYVTKGGWTYIRKRESDDIWKGLYELPLVETEAPLDLAGLLRQPMFASIGGNIPLSASFAGSMRHVLSHQVLHIRFYRVVVPENADAEGAFRLFACVPREEVKEYAFPKPVYQMLPELESEEPGGGNNKKKIK